MKINKFPFKGVQKWRHAYFWLFSYPISSPVAKLMCTAVIYVRPPTTKVFFDKQNWISLLSIRFRFTSLYLWSSLCNRCSKYKIVFLLQYFCCCWSSVQHLNLRDLMHISRALSTGGIHYGCYSPSEMHECMSVWGRK